MDFAEWLDGELHTRGWGQSDLVRQARMAGHSLSSGQLSHILGKTRQAGPETCIAIAEALHLPREEVFRARGWLLTEPNQVVSPGAPPEVAELMRRLETLPLDKERQIATAFNALLDATSIAGNPEEESA